MPFVPLRQIEYTLHRDTRGLGINIAGGKGSTPYKEHDEVSLSTISSWSDRSLRLAVPLRLVNWLIEIQTLESNYFM